MTVRRAGWIVALGLVLAGCWPFGGKGDPKPKPVPAPVAPPTPRAIDSLWRVAERDFGHGKWNQANQLLTRLSTIMPVNDRRLTRLRFYQGEIELALGNELDAVRHFRRISDETPDDSLAGDALVRAGDAYMSLWRKPELDPTYGTTSLSVYQEVLSRYPDSPAAKRADLRIKELSERFAEKEYGSGLYYYKFKAYDSAILVLRSLIAQYPRTKVVPQALDKLVRSYQAREYQEDVKEICEYIGRFYPSLPVYHRLCPAAQATKDSVGKP
jgi:outer membrane assembly lipoprotein YfiO